MKRLLAALAALALAGCASTYGSAPTETKSGFSGARVVTISTHGAACTSMQCTSLGAQWDSSKPERALLTVRLTGVEFTGITGAAFAIDGREVSIRPNSGISQFEALPGGLVRQSTHDFTVPLSLIRDITSARKVWIRVTTTKGYFEDAVIDGDKDSKAYHALVRFLAQVDGTANKN